VSDAKPGGWKMKAAVGALGFVLLVLLMATFFGKRGLIEMLHARKTYEILLKDIEALKQEKARLEKDIASLEANPQAVDKDARKQLWLMKPDEKVIIRR